MIDFHRFHGTYDHYSSFIYPFSPWTFISAADSQRPDPSGRSPGGVGPVA